MTSIIIESPIITFDFIDLIKDLLYYLKYRSKGSFIDPNVSDYRDRALAAFFVLIRLRKMKARDFVKIRNWCNHLTKLEERQIRELCARLYRAVSLPVDGNTVDELVDLFLD